MLARVMGLAPADRFESTDAGAKAQRRVGLKWRTTLSKIQNPNTGTKSQHELLLSWGVSAEFIEAVRAGACEIRFGYSMFVL